MKRSLIASTLVALALAFGAHADVTITGGGAPGAPPPTTTVAGLPTCNDANQGARRTVTDAGSGAVCTAGGAFRNVCRCDDGVWEFEGAGAVTPGDKGDITVGGTWEIDANAVGPTELADNACTEPKLDILNSVTDEQSLTWESTGGRMEWAARVSGATVGGGLVTGGAAGAPTLGMRGDCSDGMLLEWDTVSGWICATDDGAAGAGDVTGPAGVSVSDALPVFDGTTGKLIKQLTPGAVGDVLVLQSGGAAAWDPAPLLPDGEYSDIEVTNGGEWLELNPLVVSATELNTNAVTTGKILNGTVGADDLGADSVSASELNVGGVEVELEAALELDDLQGTLSVSKLNPSLVMDNASYLKNTWSASERGYSDFVTLRPTTHAVALGDCSPITNGAPYLLTDWDRINGQGLITGVNGSLTRSNDQCIAGSGTDYTAVCYCEWSGVQTYPVSLGTATVSSGTTTRLEVATVVWADNQFNGQWVRLRENEGGEEWRLVDDTFASSASPGSVCTGAGSCITWTAALNLVAAAPNTFVIQQSYGQRLMRDPHRLVGSSVWEERYSGTAPTPVFIHDDNDALSDSASVLLQEGEAGSCREAKLSVADLNDQDTRNIVDIMRRATSIGDFRPRIGLTTVTHIAMQIATLDGGTFMDTFGFVGMVNKTSTSLLVNNAPTTPAEVVQNLNAGFGVVFLNGAFYFYGSKSAANEFTVGPHASLDFSGDPTAFTNPATNNGVIEFLLYHYYPASWAPGSYRKKFMYRIGQTNQGAWQTAYDCQSGQACFDTTDYTTDSHRLYPAFGMCKETGSPASACSPGGPNSNCASLGVRKITNYRFPTPAMP